MSTVVSGLLGLLMVVAPVAIIPSPSQSPKAQAVEVATSTTTSTTVPAVKVPLVAPEIMVKWNKVAWCESHGNWHQVHEGDQAFSGALGIKNYVWRANGGLEFGWTAGHATPEEQVIVARNIQANAGYPEFVPDQNGSCDSW